MSQPRAKKRAGRYGKVYADILTEAKLHDLMSVRGGKNAFSTWSLGLALVAKELTDGVVMRAQMRTIYGTDQDAAALVRVGLWVEHLDGWYYVNYVESGAGITRAEVDSLKRQGEISACKGWMKSGRECVCGEHEQPDGPPDTDGLPIGLPIDQPNGLPNSEPDGLPIGVAKDSQEPRAKSQERTTTSAAVAATPPRPAATVAIPGDPPPETINQRVNRVTKTYTDVVKMSRFPAIMSIVKKAIVDAGHDDDSVIAALARLAAEGRSVTTETLRIELDGQPAYRNGQSTRSQRAMADANQLLANAAAREALTDRTEITA